MKKKSYLRPEAVAVELNFRESLLSLSMTVPPPRGEAEIPINPGDIIEGDAADAASNHRHWDYTWE